MGRPLCFPCPALLPMMGTPSLHTVGNVDPRSSRLLFSPSMALTCSEIPPTPPSPSPTTPTFSSCHHNVASLILGAAAPPDATFERGVASSSSLLLHGATSGLKYIYSCASVCYMCIIDLGRVCVFVSVRVLSVHRIEIERRVLITTRTTQVPLHCPHGVRV